jgi:hypothetical protein
MPERSKMSDFERRVALRASMLAAERDLPHLQPFDLACVRYSVRVDMYGAVDLKGPRLFVSPDMDDEKALPRSEDELEEEPGAIQPFNRLGCSPIQFKMNKMNSFEQRPGWSRCSMKKRSWCGKPRECQKCSRRLSELRDKQERKRRDAHAIRWKLQHVDSP